MKATLTLEFDNAAALHAFVDRMRGKEPMPITINIPAGGDAQRSMTAEPAAEKTRKPRSDAGKPRGPYKTNGEPAAGEAQQETAKASAESSSPTTTDSPDARVAEQRTVNPPEAGANPVGGPTLDDAKAALGRIKDTKGLGTPTCIGHLQSYGVNRISDLPKEKYAEFIKAADELIARHAAGAK